MQLSLAVRPLETSVLFKYEFDIEDSVDRDSLGMTLTITLGYVQLKHV